ncbi:MAG: CvpA family protein [Anaerolineales bacterium]|nr:CvpA family protein [Anaerolineales bacterium]
MGLAGLNWIDLTILLIAVFSLVIGYVQGMLRQIVWLAALYIATILGAQYHSLVGGWIRALTFQEHSSRIVNAIAFLIIVVVVSFLLSWLASDAYPTEKLKLFPLVNQIGGSILALVTMVVMISVLLWVVLFSVGEPWPGNESLRFALSGGLQSSLLVPVFDSFKEPLLKSIIPWLPAGLPAIFNL